MKSTETITALLANIEKGAAVEYLYFWGHTPKVPGATDRSCLSNWFPACFTVDENTSHSAEQFMMSEKARLFKNRDTLQKIIAARDPGRAKRLGRRVQQFNEEKWTTRRFGIVVRGVKAEFSQNRNLQKYLAGTSEKVLVEVSPHDRTWGIGMAQDDARAGQPHEWEG